MRVDDNTRRHIRSHYRTHTESYTRIWSKLDAIRERLEDTDRDGKIAHLKLSYINAVISIRTTADKQDEAVARLMAGYDLETALASVNYHTQKRKHMRRSLDDEIVWNEIAVSLEADDLYSAHEIALDRLGYIGTVKAPFIFAMLGYTQKMCIDGNALRVLGLDDYPSTKDIHEYERLCRAIREEFPQLSAELDPFHLHWVIFDWQRSAPRNGDEPPGRSNPSGRVTQHDAWFEAALCDIPRIQEMIDSIE